MTYINYKAYGELETIDEYPTKKEARAMLYEYELAFNRAGYLYLSSRPTRAWRGATLTRKEQWS